MADTDRAADLADADHMRRSYVRVILAWLVILAALYAFQESFSVR